nr:uncharacterized protein LOC117844426 [Setaria viridis]
MATWGSHGGVDRISSLPDHLLHTILLHLSDAELSFRYHRDAGARTWAQRAWAHRRVDAALAAYPGPTVTLLDIDLPLWAPAPREHPVDPDRDDPLLRFLASQRVAGELRLLLRDRGWGDVVLPPCERVTAISLSVIALTLRFQPLPDGGTFAALAILRITSARVDSRELGDVLSSRCPRLKELYLKRVGLMKDRDRVLSIRSNSLERLEMDMKVYHGARLQVIAPKLRVFVSPRIFSDAPIVAPMLLEMCWDGPYDPSRRHLGEAGRHLQRLDIAKNTTPAATMLMRQFYAVHELQLTVQIWKGNQEYNRYLTLINSLPKCEVLVVGFVVTQHAIKPVMLQFLNRCVGVKKIVVRCLVYRTNKCQCKTWECQCNGSKQSHKIDSTALDSLELVEIKENMEAYHKVEFVKLLCEYSANFQKRMNITITENRYSEYIREKICNIHVLNDKVVIKASWNLNGLMREVVN